MDIIGKALLDYQNGRYSEDIITHSSLDEEDVIPLPYLFRDFKDMPILEQKALELCKGKVLDIGCGAGSHALYLQERKFEVTAIDNSEGAARTSELRGVRNVKHCDFYDFEGETFDTILLLMNGSGLAERLDQMNRFLTHLTSLLKPNGQILIDSSDIIYMFDKDVDGGIWLPNTGSYYGEVIFSMEYKGEKSDPFSWLFCDFNTLQAVTAANNFNCELIMEGEHYHFLARLTLK